MSLAQVRVEVWEKPLDVAQVLEGLASVEHGGECHFLGRVRAHNLGRVVRGIAYDVHEVLAQKSIRTIVEEARQKWEKEAHVLVIHRQGYLSLGEPSVLVAASCRHRDEAFRVCRYIIDEIKHRTPIWKKEFYEDGESQWVQGHALCQHRKSDPEDRIESSHQHHHV
jgi:molybdopterin synthase catalytic subunit